MGGLSPLVILLGSSAQALTDTYRWSAWGVELASTGSTTNPFGYVGALGYYDDPYLSSVHVHARRLTPHLARWRTRDPLSYAFPLYTYVNNHPAFLLDPTGLRSSCAHCERLRQEIRKLVKRIESRAPGIHAPGYNARQCKKLNDLVHEIGHDCDDHRFDETYRQDCKRPAWDRCVFDCAANPGKYGLTGLSFAWSFLDGVSNIDKFHPSPGDFGQTWGGSFVDDACENICSNRMGGYRP